LAQGSHDGTQLFGGNGAVAVLVEKSECLLEFCDLLFVQLVSHLVFLS
jgi:hypothetical protein